MLALSVQFEDALFYHTFSGEDIITVNASPGASIQVPKLEKKIQISRTSTGFQIRIQGGSQEKEIIASLNEIVVVDQAPMLVFYFSRVCSNEEAFPLPENGEFYIGRVDRSPKHSVQNNIVISYPFISKAHFRIVRRNRATYVYDMGSLNGVFLNQKKIQEAKMTNGDVLSIFTLRIILKGDCLYFENAGNHIKLYKPVVHDPCIKVAEKDDKGGQKRSFRRSPRIHHSIPSEIISLEKPPKAGGEPQINWMSVLVTPIISVGMMVFMVAFLGTNAAMLIMSGTMSVVSAVMAVSNYKRQKESHGQKTEKIESKYQEYLTGVASRLKQAKVKQLEVLREAHPDPVECVQIALNLKRQLWERECGDEDFLSVRVGVGTIPAAVTARYQRNQVVIEENILENKAVQLAENSLLIADAPILCDIKKSGRVGIEGERIAEIGLVRNMVMELATAHSYEEVKIVAVVPENELHQWDWMRWLPHCGNEERSVRYIFTSAEGAKNFFDEVSEEFNARCPDENDIYRTNADGEIPHYIFILAKRGIVEKHSIKKYLYSDTPGCSSLFVYDKLSLLPKTCTQVISIHNEYGEIYSTQNSAEKNSFRMDKSSVEGADSLSRALAPVYTDTTQVSAVLPERVTFLEGYAVTYPQQLDIGKRWGAAKTYRSLSVPIAAGAGGTPFCFDIHEKHHGVMGAVAGMTGSGKTEMVMSWLLSMATNFSPEDVSFVIIDFKGTGLLAPFRNLPHLAGGISNLDVRTKTGDIDPKRIERNLAALRSEKMRRLELLRKYTHEGKKYEINDLNRDYKRGRVPEKLPILLIVLDEFAEFKKAFPDFAKEIDSLIRTGRALGMFVVICTQTISGIVSQDAEDNFKFRWCMRVASANASRAMIGTGDAAKIRVQGRAIVKIGEEDYEQVQSYWSGAPYDPNRRGEENTFVPITKVDVSGNKESAETVRKYPKGENSGTEIGTVVQYISQYCKENNIASARKIWTNALPDRLSLFDLIDQGFDGQKWPDTTATAPIIGMVDDPNNQRQYPLSLDFAKYGHTIIYGAPGTGKTTLLQTLILSMAMTRKPDEVSIYAIDFAGWNLSSLGNLPHVGGIANANEPDRIDKLSGLISETLENRKKKFAVVGGNVSTYRKVTGEKVPDIVLVVDNFQKDMSKSPEFEQCCGSLINTGANYGVYLVTTATINAVSYKFEQNVKNKIALQLTQLGDYTAIVGKVDQTLPDIEGRGFTRDNPPRIFQTALPTSANVDNLGFETVHRLADAMRNCWTGDLPTPIPEMPETIPYGSIKTNQICLGLSCEKVCPVIYQHDLQHYLLISGMERSGKSRMLQVIARQFKEKVGGQVYAFDVLKSGTSKMEDIADVYLCDVEGIDAFVEESIRGEIRNRYEAKQANLKQEFTPIMVVVDDYAAFHKVISNDSMDRLETIVKIGSDLDFYLVVAGDAYALSSLRNKEKVTIMMANGKQTVMLGGCMADHGAMTVSNGTSQKNTEVNDTEGYFVYKGEPCRFKAMENGGVV